MRARPCSRPSLPRRAALALLFLLCAAPVARAQQVVDVSGVPETDSLTAWVSQAKAGFQSNPGDSAGGENYRPYERVGLMARRLLRSLGHRDLLQAHAIQPVLDSLGFATEVATDPAAPTFALLMVRNPSRPEAEAVGFLYWYKGDDLRIQGAVFKGGYRPRIRIWWTGTPEYPYEWGIVDETRTGRLGLTLLRLSPGGTVWGLQQDEERFPLLGETGEAQWVDLNGDRRPELVSWTRSPTDSLFVERANCPKLLTERTFIEGREIFELQDERLLPTPYATLVYFVRLLIDDQLAQAERLVRDPARVREAVAQGWNQRVVKTPWTVEYGESGEAWPRRLELRFQGPHGVKRYGVIFARRDGRWIIENWFEPQPATGRRPSVTLPPASVAKPPAAKPPAAKPPVRPASPPAKKR
jgi:hypothetical protein